MEFDLALSCIREYVYAAVLIADDIKSNEEIIKNIDIDEYINRAKDNISKFKEENKNNMDIAYEIYRSLLKNTSKAVTAQYLSKILIKKSEEDKNLVNKIKDDQYIKYIIDAINHATNTISEATE